MIQTNAGGYMSAHRSSFVRRILAADAIISGACCVIMLAGSGFLEGVLGVPSTLLRYAGDSVLLLLTGWVAPTALGYTFIVFQAAVVALFAELQYVGLRKATIT